MELTEKDLEIHAVADKLLADNITPTLSKVRKALGGGSFTTISDSMKIWKEKQGKQKLNEAIKESAPERLKNDAQGLINEIWSTAQELANERLKSEREALELARKEYEEQAKQAAELADSISLELEDANRLIITQNKELEELTATNSEIKQQAKQQADEIIKLAEYAEEMKANFENITIENKRLYSENAKYKGQLDSLEKEKTSNLLIIKELNTSIGKLKAERDALEVARNDDKTAYEREIEKMEANMDKITKERENATRELSQYKDKDLEESRKVNVSYLRLVSKVEELQEKLVKVTNERDSLV